MNSRLWAVACLVTVLLFSGCGSSFNDNPQPGPQGPVGNATIQVNHVLARAIPSGIDTLRFVGQDLTQQVVFGPQERPVQAAITLNDVTVLTKVLTIEYLSQATIVGRFVTEVNLVPGETFVLDDPNWVDVGDFGPPVALQFMVEPTAPQSGQEFDPAIVVVVVDALRRQVEDFNGPVTIALSPTSPAGTLSGTLTVNAVNGIATFSDLSINLVGNGFSLVASADTLPSLTSPAFSVSGAPFSGVSNSIVYRAVFDPANSHFACGDLNGDGLNDVVLATATELQVLLGRSSGQFEVASTTALSASVFVRMGDITGDGQTDVVVLVDETTQFTTQVLAGDGAGNLGAPVATSIPVSDGGMPSGMELADLNGDGRSDAVIVGTDTLGSAYYVEISDGTGLGDPIRVALGADPVAVALGPLLGGAAVDMVIAVGPDLAVYSGAGDGTFSNTLNVTPSFQPQQVAIADIDGQNGNDLVTVYNDAAQSTETAVYLNGNINPFTTQALGSPYNSGQAADTAFSRNLALGDLNNDNVPDLVHVASVLNAPVGNDELTVQLSDPNDGGSLYPSFQEYTLADQAPELVLCDFNADGLLDALLSGPASNLTRLNSNLDGDFLPPTTPATDASSVLIGDVNNDGREDLVTRSQNTISVFLRDTNGVIPDTSDFDIPTMSSGEVLRLADMNNDTFLDAVIGGNSNAVEILPNPGDGDFDETDVTTITFANGVQGFSAGLINADAFPDIVATNDFNGLQVVLSNGALSYDPSVAVVGSDFVQALELVNLDADSELEVVTAQGVGGLGIYQNSAGIVTENSVVPLGGNDIRQVAVGDLDGDGVEDILAGGRSADFSELYVLLNPQTGTLSISQTISNSRIELIVDMLIGDTNADGAADLLVGDNRTGGIAVLTGDGNGTTFHSSLTHYYAGGDLSGETAIALSDLDGDGSVEIVTAVASGAWITLLTLFLIYGLRAWKVRRRRGVASGRDW